jgi:hypothetical protein
MKFKQFLSHQGKHNPESIERTKQHTVFMDSQIKQIEKDMTTFVKQDGTLSARLKYLTGIPGVSLLKAVITVAETHGFAGVQSIRLQASCSGLARSKAKPFEVHGSEIKRGLYTPGAPLPTTAKELPNPDFAIRTPFRFMLPDSAHGMRLCVVMRRENSRGVKGPWSPRIVTTAVE